MRLRLSAPEGYLWIRKIRKCERGGPAISIFQLWLRLDGSRVSIRSPEGHWRGQSLELWVEVSDPTDECGESRPTYAANQHESTQHGVSHKPSGRGSYERERSLLNC